jgi:hypothetical protein
MRTYKLLKLLLVISILWSCSPDTVDPTGTETTSNKIAFGQNDNSYLGNYRGVFTTNDGLTRGSVDITLTSNHEGIAKITLSTGEIIELQSNKVKLTSDNTVSNLRFVSGSNLETSFDFSVNGDGQEPSVSNVDFGSKPSDVFIAKNTQRAPLTPITGTYSCSNCSAVGQGFPRSGLTWNIMSIGAGNNQNFITQLSYGGRVYTSPSENNIQTNCTTSGGLTTCDLTGSIRILGYNVIWNGTHTYNTSNEISCSSVNATWSAPLLGPGIYGNLVSDTQCTDTTPTPTSTTYVGCGDKVTDHAGFDNYGPNRYDVYYIDAGEGYIADIYFNEFDLEEGRDFLQIYDGKNMFSPLITVSDVGTLAASQGFTGTDYNGAHSLYQQKVYASGRYLTLVFTSNSSNSRSGFYGDVYCIAARTDKGK